jgi:hypothetical protein
VRAGRVWYFSAEASGGMGFERSGCNCEVVCNLSVEKDLGNWGTGGRALVGSSMDARAVGATGLSDLLLSTVPFLARNPPDSVASVSSSLFFSESRLLNIDFLRETTGRLATGDGVTATSWAGSSAFVSCDRLVGEGEREGGALDSFLLKRLARDLDFEGERVRSPKTGAGRVLTESTTGAGRVLAESTTGAGRTLAESMLGVPSLSEAGGLGLCSLSAVTVILGLLCSSATRS